MRWRNHSVAVARMGWGLASVILLPLARAPAEEEADCTTCHKEQMTQLPTSVHASLSCTECHGGPKNYQLSSEQLARYTRPIAPGEVRQPFDHGADFVGKAKRPDIPNLCGSCHADVERMNQYGIPTDQLAAYWTSGHGKALKNNGDENVAVCTDCHGAHDIFKSSEVTSRTHPRNVPDTCGRCHGDEALMSKYDLPAQIMDEYRESVHGNLLLDLGDLGAPNCATCHGNHAAAPPGFASVQNVCGQCHQAASKNFATSIHASQEEFHGCVQCHGGGPDAHFHKIERINQPPGILIQRYKHLMSVDPDVLEANIAETIHPDPQRIIKNAIESCTECHDDLQDDESLPKLFQIMDGIGAAERRYVTTASYLDKVGQGVLLVDNQRFKFEDAKTHLIALAPLQHTLDNDKVEAKVEELNKVCDEVTTELKDLEKDLGYRYSALGPMWGFCIVFSIALYVKFKRLKKQYVKPLP